MAKLTNNISPNRAQQITSRDSTVQDITVGIYDVDEAISFYFNQVIRPKVDDGEEMIDVPVIYGSPERWKSVQRRGVLRDRRGKIQIPLIMYRRTNLERVEGMMGSKIDAADPSHIKRQFAVTYNKRNRYDNFSILQGVKPSNEFYNVILPDYFKMTYDCVIWTDYVVQQNKIIEDINYNANSYWGDKDSFKFLATMDSFATETNLEQGLDRNVKATFQLVLNGYVIPDNVQKDATDFVKRTFTQKSVAITEAAINDVNNPTNSNTSNAPGTGSAPIDEGSSLDATTQYYQGEEGSLANKLNNI